MNMLSKNALFVSISFVYLSACVYKTADEVNLVVTTDGNGNLQSEIPYTNHGTIHGLAKYYYYPDPKNVLKDEIEIENGRKQGWHKHYRRDGTLESKIYFKNNLPDGENYWYYENGQLSSESFWTKNKQYGNAIFYYMNGKFKHYYSSDYFGNTLYVIKWDSIGNKIREEGVVFSPKFLIVYSSDTTESHIEESEIQVGKEIIIKVTVAQPPQTQTIVRMGELDAYKMTKLPVKNYTATYRRTFTKSGKYTIMTAGEILDEQNNVLRRDSTAVVLNVK